MARANTAEDQIRNLLTRWEEAFRAKDAKAVMSVYAPGDVVVAFDIVPPLAKVGSDAYGQNYEEFFAMFAGPLRVELRDLRIIAGDDVAFLHCFDRMSGTLQGGDHFDLWLRVTSGLQKIDGEWLILHDHVSVPTNFETGTAALNLAP
ncbi:MAG TPA: SgcJ/EcaC family oxidoreductase [Gemmatimonadaceae bacterium]|nr:SgcJ/EcaC family oxidoreductase [Gemmatimonadaceae bacterium]